MNLPISWAAAVAVIPASQVVKQASSSAARSANQFFGNLLPSPAADNGRSVSKTEQSKNLANSPRSWNERVESVRKQLSLVVQKAKSSFGSQTIGSDSAPYVIDTDGMGKPKVSGPEPIRTILEQHLGDNAPLTDELNFLANTPSSGGPLQWLPGIERANNTTGPLRISIK